GRITELKAAGWASCTQVGEERNRGWIALSGDKPWHLAAGQSHVDRAVGTQAAANGIGAAAEASRQLRADVASKGPGGSYHARFNLNLRRLAVQRADQLFNLWQHAGYIFNDQRVATIICHHITAGREEFFNQRGGIFGMSVTQIPR